MTSQDYIWLRDITTLSDNMAGSKFWVRITKKKSSLDLTILYFLPDNQSITRRVIQSDKLIFLNLQQALRQEALNYIYNTERRCEESPQKNRNDVEFL